MNKRDKRVFQKILKYCAKVSKAHQLFHDDKALFLDEEEGFAYRDTVSMSILQIGELANALTPEMRQAHPDIPWHEIVKMRNIAAHHYDDWDYERAWDTSRDDVPALEEKVRGILAEDEAAPSPDPSPERREKRELCMAVEKLQKIKTIVQPIAEEYGLERVSLFGSRARGEERPDSDYDFLISAKKLKSLFKLGGLLNDLEDALGTDVDIVTDDCNDPEFVQDIKQDEVIVYEQAV